MTVPSELWIQTSKGGVFNFLSAADSTLITPSTIAFALARIPRFGGHSTKPWFVAEHCIMVKQIGLALIKNPLEKRYAAPYLLLHDAHEAFVGDMPAPLKKYLKNHKNFDMKEVENEIDIRIRKDLRLPTPVAWCKDLIEEADIYALKIERFAFMASRHEWLIDSVELPDGLGDIGVRALTGGPAQMGRMFTYEIETAIGDFIDVGHR
jgi:hypothetical protein